MVNGTCLDLILKRGGISGPIVLIVNY